MCQSLVTYVCTILFVKIPSQRRSSCSHIISCTGFSVTSLCYIGQIYLVVLWYMPTRTVGNTDQGTSVLITISVYVVIDTTKIENQSLTFVQNRAWHEWHLGAELDPYCGQRWGLSTSQGLMMLETHFQGSKIECLELYCYYTANNWCQQSAASSTGNQKILLFSLSIHDPISYLSISCCRVKEASFSVAAAQSVSFSGVEDQPAHQILSSMLKLKISF